MRTNLIFSIESILFGLENTRGPIELVQFANRLASHEGISWFNRMANIEFNNSSINKALPGGVPVDNTLVIGQERGEYLDLYLCIKSGRNCCRIATAHFPDGEVYIHDEYRHTVFLDKLNEDEIKSLLNYVRERIDLIYPKPANQEY